MSADAGELGRSGGGNERAREQLFFPPLAQQRTELLARVLRRSGATAVVDLGCGERASTLRRLATGSVRGERRTDEQMRAARAARDGAEPFKFAPPPFRSLQLAELLGVELREQAAEQAVDAIKTRSAALAEKAPRTRIYLGDMLDAPPPELRDIIRGENDDGGANGLVWASEVVEHLDPEPLSRFPAALLGGHPQVAVVTTPNADYNVHLPGVRRPCDGAERPFRDPDHRFEWTRAQFQEWAKAAAFTHGYEVEFAGVGSLPNSDLLKALKKRLHQSLALFYSASTLDVERPKPEGLPPGAGALRHLLHEGSDASMPPLEEGLTLDELEADVDAALGALSTSVIFDSHLAACADWPEIRAAESSGRVRWVRLAARALRRKLEAARKGDWVAGAQGQMQLACKERVCVHPSVSKRFNLVHREHGQAQAGRNLISHSGSVQTCNRVGMRRRRGRRTRPRAGHLP